MTLGSGSSSMLGILVEKVQLGRKLEERMAMLEKETGRVMETECQQLLEKKKGSCPILPAYTKSVVSINMLIQASRHWSEHGC